MHRSLLAPLAVVLLLPAACNFSVGARHASGGQADFAVSGSEDAGPPVLDGRFGTADPCGDPVVDPGCKDFTRGPEPDPFSLPSDPGADPLVRAVGLTRDPSGYLGLEQTRYSFSNLWLANFRDFNGMGTVSRLDTSTVREVARYPSVTCYSLPGGSTEACDGTRGCCSIDDWPRYQARKAGGKQPGHQAVQTVQNSPSRTSVDFNGDLFIANRAFAGQSSITKIANDVSGCIDRNHNGRIDTSSDVSGDGAIDPDCNGDGLPDDVASVKQAPCKNALAQEYYGQDDECVLWTSNTFDPVQYGRAVAIVGGANDSIVSDVWAGSFVGGTFVRIDGVTGLDKDDAQLPADCHAYSMAVDAHGIAWVTDQVQGNLCYFDTGSVKDVGITRAPDWGPAAGYNILVDRDQNVWLTADLKRYTPDRSNGFKNLGNGWWTRIVGVPSAAGFAVDSRSANEYFLWHATDFFTVLRVPASTIKVVKKDQDVMPAGWPTIDMPANAVGVDSQQNVWGLARSPDSIATRAVIDNAGAITQPAVLGPAKGNDRCPAGDSCTIPINYNMTDFTAFGLRNATRPQGTYALVVKGCVDDGGSPRDTQWWQASWDADVPPGTSITVHARSGSSLDPADPSWAQNAFTADATASPINLQETLTPNLTPDGSNLPVHDPYLFLEFTLKTGTRSATPRLKRFDVGFKCAGIG